MPLNAIYDDKETFEEGVVESFREMYTEKDGKFEFTGVIGLKTQADMDRVQEGINKERTDHKATKTRLAAFGELNMEQNTKDLDELTEARVRLEAGEGKIDEGKMEQIVAARVATNVTPIQRELDAANKTIAEQADQIVGFEHKDTTRTITDAVRKAALAGKVVESALDDVLMLGERIFEVTDTGAVLTRDEVGCTPGIAPDIWLSEVQPVKTHWWPVATGAGANGSGPGVAFANNPFTAEHWNLTHQGAAIKDDHGKAERMATAAGTKIGGPRPVAKKVA